MQPYLQAFGTQFNLGFNPHDYPFLIDNSYGNDTCVSFYFKQGDQYRKLWVDHEMADDREENGARYTIESATNEGTDEAPEIYAGADAINIFECETSEHLIAHLNLISSK
ncbi:hypothetical protein [Shewanella frigidimarina]|uniref:Uncharacterized protein n=1 Tax=Shewanella frigidimarina TaxID=56812 RepID=A0A106BXT4_SHEFR|nr:hypothetical protein [Shewanella frigidimarina]KVX00570.1 hypothetical protein AWJ07_07390 [Shewanella frigidimarina]|tara:strand:- start:3479 stop:3808 length:330 start_codon:yes stop_codon:yes gene_type:complete